MAGKQFIGLGWLLGVSLISGCGGSSGEEKSIFSNVAYAEYQGATSSVELDVTNAKKFAHYASQSIDLVELLHSFAGIEKTYGERVYVLTGGDFREDTSDQEACPSGGNFRVGEQSDDKGDVRITYEFDQCGDESNLLDGTVIVDGRLSDDGINVKIRIGELRIRYQEVASSELDLVVSGEIESLLSEYGYYQDNTQWTANLVIASEAEDLQIQVQDLVRMNRRTRSIYDTTGNLFISDEGMVGVSLDTSAQTLNVTGNHSSLNINFDLNEEGSDGYFFPVDSLAIQLNSELESIPAQTITLTPEQLIEQYFRNVVAPQITWNDPIDVTKGDVVELAPQIIEPDSFLEYSWSVVSETNECEVITNNAGASYAITSDCDGDVVARLSVFDGFNAYAHDYEFRFKKAPAQVTFESFDGVADVSSTFSLNAAIANPEEGPFEYQLSYGAPGASISESGVFNWALDPDYPNLFSRMEFHYGASVRNDDATVKDLKVTVDFEEETPSELIPYVPAPESVSYTWYAGGIDLEPENPNGDIAFISIHFGADQLVKLNKNTKQLRVIGELPELEGVSSAADFDKRTRFIDWNEDGIDDLIYSRSYVNDVGALTELVVFDMKAERAIYQQPLFSTRYIYSPDYFTKPVLQGFQRVDVNSDGVTELIFEFSQEWSNTTSTSLIDGQTIVDGIVAFDMSDGRFHQLLEDTSYQFTDSFLVGDFDRDSAIDLMMYERGRSEIHLYRFDPTTYELAFIKRRALSNDVGVGRDYRNLLFFESKDIDGDNQEEVSFLFGTDDRRCHRLVETGDDRPDCLSSHVVYDAHLNLIRSNPLNIISDHIAPIHSSSAEDSELLMMHARDLVQGGTRVMAFDPFAGEVVWSSLSDDPNLFNPFAATLFTDSSGKQQLAVGQNYGVVVTQ